MTDFLYNPGTNGFTSTPYNLLSSELNSLANNTIVTSSVGGTSGVFSQTNTGNAMLGAIYFVAGGAFTPTQGGYLLGWFSRSPDGGTNFEKSLAAVGLARSPDFIIPLQVTAYATSDIAWCQDPEVRLPFESNKIILLNASGVTLPASGNLIKLGPVGVVRA